VALRRASLAFLVGCLPAIAVVSVSRAGSAARLGLEGRLYVSPHAAAGAVDKGCDSAAHSSIQAAVDDSTSGGTVVVCRGSYPEDVVVSTPLKLVGKRGAVVHATATANGNCDQNGPFGPGSAPCLAGITVKSSNVTVVGLTVTGAIG
jgi:pectin methylesterase-like acyl-CoA thioesterase